MAIYHLSVKTVSRGSGRSSVGAAAYRAGEKLENERDGVTHDYTKRSGVTHTEIMLPDHAPREYQNRVALWNAVESAEKAKNARTAREVEIALPNELSRKEQIELVRQYVKENFTDKGMCADIAIHSGRHKHDRSDEAETGQDKNIKPDNPHAHILLTTRPIDQNGKWGDKQKKEYILDKNGNRQYDKKKQTYKCKTVKAVDWDEKETLKKWRESWANAVNRELEKKNIPDRVDHRSLQEQGQLLQRPTIHLGPAAHRMELRGIRTEKGDFNWEVKRDNEAMERDTDRISKELSEIRRRQEEILKRLSEDRGRESEQPKNPDAPQATKTAALPIGRDTEKIGQEMGRLKHEFRQGTQYIEAAKAKHSELARNMSSTAGQIDRINKSKTAIESNEKKVEQLQAQKDSLPRFGHKKEKKALDAQIDSVKRSQSQAEQTLKMNYGITKEQIPAKLDELSRQAITTKKEMEKLPGPGELQKLQESLDRTEEKYKSLRIQADVLPRQDRQAVQTAEDKYMKLQKTTRDVAYNYRTDTKLRHITPKEYQKLKNEMSPSDRKHLEQRDKLLGKDAPDYTRGEAETHIRGRF